MESILIRPKSEKQLLFLKTFLENLRWNLDVEYNQEEDLEKSYDLKELNNSVMKQKEAGTLKEVNPKNIWESIS